MKHPGFSRYLPALLLTGALIGYMALRQAPEAQVLPGTQTKPLLPAKFPPSSPSPEAQRLKSRILADKASRQKPTPQILLEKIRTGPGGPEKIAEAIARGARLSGPSGPPVVAPFSITLTPESPESPYVSGFYGIGAVTPWCNTQDLSLAYWTSVGGTVTEKPSLSFYFDVPADGWYILNVEASGARASWKNYDTSTVTTVETLNYPDRYGTYSYPTLVELSAGSHHFYWVVESESWVYVFEADVFSAL
jgi:hypothetical protein